MHWLEDLCPKPKAVFVPFCFCPIGRHWVTGSLLERAQNVTSFWAAVCPLNVGPWDPGEFVPAPGTT